MAAWRMEEIMGAGRTLTRKINEGSLAKAKLQAAKRAHKYWHASERLRQMARLSRAKLVPPNRES